MTVRFLQIAQMELDDAIEYYQAEQPGLGYRFLAEVLDTLDRIGTFPRAWQPFYGDSRRCLMRRFPYGIIYLPEGKDILVLAVAHLHRKPDYWMDRLKKP